MRLLAALLIAVVAAPCLAQLTPEEAQAKLRTKQEQRARGRAEPVTIPRGQLEDMTAEIQRLSAEVAALRQQVAGGKPVPKPAIAKKHDHLTLEIGMTRAEVLDFVRSHPTFKIIGFHANKDANVQTETVRTITQDNLQPAAPGQQAVPGQDATQRMERETVGQKHETIEVATFHTEEYAVEPAHTALSRHGLVAPQQTQTRDIRDGTLRVQLTDDVVTGIDAG